MLIQILVDNPKSWIVPYVDKLIEKLKNIGHDAYLIHKHKEVIKGDILFLLSCERKFTNLNLNKFNIVIHESDLPKGKGWSPLTWQILSGINKIPVTLLEASDEIDSGNIYLQRYINLKGHELFKEIKHLQGKITIDLVLEFVEKYKVLKPRYQVGESTFYQKRNIKDSELNINKTIIEQFNLLRVCDNENYPAYFEMFDRKYIIKIEIV